MSQQEPTRYYVVWEFRDPDAHGIEVFDSGADAQQWININLAHNRHFRVFAGRELKVETVQTVTKVQLT